MRKFRICLAIAMAALAFAPAPSFADGIFGATGQGPGPALAEGAGDNPANTQPSAVQIVVPARAIVGAQIVTAGPTADPYVNWVIRRRQSLGLGDMAAITNEICMATRGGVIVAIPCSYRPPAPSVVAVAALPCPTTDGVIYSPYVPRLSLVRRFRVHAYHAHFYRRSR